MFTIIRKFRLTRGSAVEVSRAVRGGFVPLLQELPGFRGYYLLEGGPDVLIRVRVFDSADAALASNEIAATWIGRTSSSSSKACQSHGRQRSRRCSKQTDRRLRLNERTKRHQPAPAVMVTNQIAFSMASRCCHLLTSWKKQ